MNKQTTWIIVGIAVILGGWYWFSSMKSAPVVTVGSPATSQTTPTAGNPAAQAGINQEGAGQTNTGQTSVAPILKSATDAKLGSILVASNGMTLYMYAQDTAGVSNCSGQCAVNWPPYTVLGNEPQVLGDGITGKLDTITRADGSVQLTYNGTPLYFRKNDVKAGDTTGQNVGGVWTVVNP